MCVCALYACTIMINHVYKFYKKKFYYVLFYISYHLLSLGATLFHWDSSTGFQALSLWRDCASNVWCPPWISNYVAWDRCCYAKMSFTFRVLISCLLMHFEFLFRSIDLSPSFICLSHLCFKWLIACPLLFPPLMTFADRCRQRSAA